MQTLRYLLRNITVLNIALLLSVFLLSYFTILPLLSMNIQLALPSLKKIEAENVAMPQPEAPMLADYMLIAEQNLFHPERKIPEKKEEKQLQKPEFVLYGTLITDDANIAYMEDLKAPHNTPGRGKRQKAIQKGTIFSGFTLSEIHHDKVVMLRADEKIEVRILDQQNKKTRGIETTASVAAGKSPDPESQEIKSAAGQPQRARVQVTSPSADKKKLSEERKAERDARRNKVR